MRGRIYLFIGFTLDAAAQVLPQILDDIAAIVGITSGIIAGRYYWLKGNHQSFMNKRAKDDAKNHNISKEEV